MAVPMESAVFWGVMLCGPENVYQYSAGMYYIYLQGSRESQASCKCLALKMEAVCFSETPVTFYQMTLHHIREDSTLQYCTYCEQIIHWFSI
jgi:hypothetical protein